MTIYLRGLESIRVMGAVSAGWTRNCIKRQTPEKHVRTIRVMNASARAVLEKNSPKPITATLKMSELGSLLLFPHDDDYTDAAATLTTPYHQQRSRPCLACTKVEELC